MKRARDPAAVRAAIAERRLTQRELARLAGCSQGLIGFLLKGERSVNSRLARRIARVLQRSVDELFADVETTAKPQSDNRQAVA